MEHEESKRGRGRPKLDGAKSAAERMKLYRQRKKAQEEIKRNVTEIRPASVGMLESRIVLLNAENMQLSDKLQAALDKIAALEGKLKSVMHHGKSK